MRILLVSQMYPGPDDPDLGVFVAQLERALQERGHDVERAVLDRRAGGKRRFLELRQNVRAAAAPDVVWAHFLVPSGLFATAVDAPLVVTAHGRDVRNVGALPGVAALTRRVVQRASTVIAVSDYLRRELETKVPAARGKTEVVDSGVDLDRFTVLPRANGRDGPSFVCLGSLSERKNVVRLADAFARVGRGSLTFVGDGPLRPRLEGRPDVRVIGRVPHSEVPRHLAAADVVCAPSLIELRAARLSREVEARLRRSSPNKAQGTVLAAHLRLISPRRKGARLVAPRCWKFLAAARFALAMALSIVSPPSRREK